MATMKKGKRKEAERATPTKEEYAVAKFLRFKVPTREGNLQGIEVNCFYADDAVNTLLDSRWAKGKDCLFTDRKSCVEYCSRLLRLGMFHRAKLAKKPEKPDKRISKLPGVTGEGRDSGAESSRKGKSGANRGGDSATEGSKEPSTRKAKRAAAEAAAAAATAEEAAKNGKKKLKKLKLEMRDELAFVDGREVCVWIYDPTSAKTFAGGLLLIFGAIAFCLYPLWPQEMRGSVYYLSMAAIGLLIFLLIISILRHVLFLVVWVVTGSKNHFWVLPNLWQDCGFFESFKPFYTNEVKDSAAATSPPEANDTAPAATAGVAQANGDEDDDIEESPSQPDGARARGSSKAADSSSGAEDNADPDFEIVDAPTLTDEEEEEA